MKTNLIVASVWIGINTIAYLFGGLFATIVATYTCMVILWIFRNKIK